MSIASLARTILVPEVLPPDKPMDREAFIIFISDLVDRSVPSTYDSFPSAKSLRDYVFDIVFDGLDDAGIAPKDDPADAL